MIGIYKITNPKGRIYVGQSLNINRRFATYKIESCKGQTRLYASFKKYGVEKHKFEIITQCNENELNELERYYQEMYNCISKHGLNCQLVKTDTQKYKHSEETKLKISNSNIGKVGRKYKMSDEHKMKIGNANKGNKRPDFSKTLSELNKNKIGCLNPFFGKKHLDETKTKVSNSRKGKAKGSENYASKIVLNVDNGIYYDTISEASIIYGFNSSHLSRILNNKIKNKTNLILA